MKVSKAFGFILIAFSLLVFVSCASAPTVEFTVLEPSEIDMTSYKNIAVTSTVPYRSWYNDSGYIPFRNYRTKRYTNYNFGWNLNPYIDYSVPLPRDIASYATSSLVSALHDTNYFNNIVGPSVADRVYSALGVNGVSRERILEENNIDAFITSEISTMSSSEYIDVKPIYRYVYYPVGSYPYSRQSYKYDDYEGFEDSGYTMDSTVSYDDYASISLLDYDEDDDYFDDFDDYSSSSTYYYKKSSPYSRTRYERRRVIDHFEYTLYQTVEVALTYRVEDAHTGYTIATRTVRDEYSKVTDITPYTRYAPSYAPYYKRLLNKISESVLRSLAPHKVRIRETLMVNDPQNDEAENAYKLVENNNYSLAIDEFLSVWYAYKHLPSGYNAAILYFATGNYSEALSLLREVYDETKNMDVANKLRVVESYKRQNDKAESQM